MKLVWNIFRKKVYISFDIDGLDPKLCPNTGTPVAGGLEVEQVLYIARKVVQTGRKFIGFDLLTRSVAAHNVIGMPNVGAHLSVEVVW